MLEVYGLFAPLTFRLFTGRFAPWTFRPLTGRIVPDCERFAPVSEPFAPACKGVFIATQLNSTQLNCHLSMNVVTQLTQFVGRDVINKNTTDLAVRCSTGSVELS